MDGDREGSEPRSGLRTKLLGHRSSATATWFEGSRTGPSTLLVVGSEPPQRLTPLRNRPWTRLAVRALASSLDRRLAEGRSPESNRLLAARAQLLVSPAVRRTYAELWANLLARARRSPVSRSTRGPLNRQAVAGCEEQITEVCSRLSSRCPMSARGVAMASWLLRDGAGPVHNPHLPVDRLEAALGQLIELLDPVAGWMQ